MIFRLSCGVSAPESRSVTPVPVPVPLAASSMAAPAISCTAAELVAAVLDPPHPVNRPAKRAAASAAASQCLLCFILFPSLFFGKTTKISR